MSLKVDQGIPAYITWLPEAKKTSRLSGLIANAEAGSISVEVVASGLSSGRNWRWYVRRKLKW
jgi:hypothetical protein